jgi:hypothetical protein
MGTFHEPKILQTLQSAPIDNFIADGPGGGELSSRDSLSFSDHYERMLWLLPDEVCGTLLSEWVEVINAKRSSYELCSHLWPSLLGAYGMSSRLYKPGKSKTEVVELSEALTFTSQGSASAGVDLQYGLRWSYYQ